MNFVFVDDVKSVFKAALLGSKVGKIKGPALPRSKRSRIRPPAAAM
jgi:hypothetical protein